MTDTETDAPEKDAVKESRKASLEKLGFSKRGPGKTTVTKKPQANKPLAGDETGDNPDAEGAADYQEGAGESGTQRSRVNPRGHRED